MATATTPDSQPDSARAPSVQLIRAASAAFGHPLVWEDESPTEETPLQRTTSRRADMEQQVNQRRREELGSAFSQDTFMRGLYAVAIGFLIIVLVAFITYMTLFVRAILAAIYHGHKPCDQPLKYYSFAILIWGAIGRQLNQQVMKCLQPQMMRNPRNMFLVMMLLSVPLALIISWGALMVISSKTCSRTNPDLYYPTKHYVIFQAAGHLLVLLTYISLFLVFPFTSLLSMASLASRLGRSPSCVGAVERLPKIAPDSRELIDPEDGLAMDCAICMETLMGSPDSGLQVVRGPCNHYFHEECLLTWCKSHLDCPLCRNRIGTPDSPDGDYPDGDAA